MNTQTPYSHDAKTLLLDRYGRAPRHAGRALCAVLALVWMLVRMALRWR